VCKIRDFNVKNAKALMIDSVKASGGHATKYLAY